MKQNLPGNRFELQRETAVSVPFYGWKHSLIYLQKTTAHHF